ncbi:MAG: HXXEE domain-containing protein [Geminicoccaceae bacterium]
MEAQVGWGTAILFIALAAAHAVEGIVAECRSASDGCSIARFAGLVGDRIGPLLLLVALAAAGVLVDDFWIWLALGIVAADLVRHAAASIRARAYTPGAVTGALLAVYVLSFVTGSASQPLWGEASSWGAMVIGMAFVAIGQLSTQRKRPLEADRTAGKP